MAREDTPDTPTPDDRLNEAAAILADALLEHYLRERRTQRLARGEVQRDLARKEASRG